MSTPIPRLNKLAALLLMLLLVSCGRGEVSSNSVATAVGEQRLLIIGSYLAEMVVAMGAADRVVGVGAGTEHITELQDVPVIPGYRNTSSENMLSLSPTVALFSGRQTRPELIEQLELSGVEVFLFPDDGGSIDAVSDHIMQVGDILGLPERAESVVSDFNRDLEEALALVADIESKPRGLFILSGGGRPTVVAGANTDIAMLIEMAGAQNMTSDIQDFKPMSQEKMLEAAPDFILINKEGAELKGDMPVALTAPGVLLTPAGINNKVITLPSGYLVGLGLNTPLAIESLARQIHPELADN